MHRILRDDSLYILTVFWRFRESVFNWCHWPTFWIDQLHKFHCVAQNRWCDAPELDDCLLLVI